MIETDINDVEFMKIAGGRLSQRWIFAFMGFLAILNAYTMRVCLSITITEMAVSIEHNYTDDTCRYDLTEKENGTAVNSTKVKYDWDERTQVKDILHEIIN